MEADERASTGGSAGRPAVADREAEGSGTDGAGLPGAGVPDAEDAGVDADGAAGDGEPDGENEPTKLPASNDGGAGAAAAGAPCDAIGSSG